MNKLKCLNGKNRLILKDAIIADKYKEVLKQIKWRLKYSVISKEEMLKMINNVLGDDNNE